MKLDNRGWGFKMMAFLMLILISFLIVAIILIYKYYDNMSISINNTVNMKYVGEL